jgi:hypothetical protein
MVEGPAKALTTVVGLLQIAHPTTTTCCTPHALTSRGGWLTLVSLEQSYVRALELVGTDATADCRSGG